MYLARVARATMVLATPVMLGAQAAPRMPIAPDSVLRPSAADAEFASWMRGQREAGSTERALVIQSGRFEVLALSPLARAALAPEAVFGSMVAGCQAIMQLVDSLAAGIRTIDPWEPFEAAAAAAPVLAFSIVPSSSVSVDCGATEPARRAALARGVRFGRNAEYLPTNDALRAELWVNGVRITPALSGRAPVTQVAESRLWLDGTAQIRLYVAPETVAPDAKGAMPSVELRVWNAKDDVPDRIIVDAGTLRALWASELRWRAARLDAGAAVASNLRFPEPSDSALKRARRQLEAGDQRGAVVTMVERLPAAGIPSADARYARLQVAFAFDAAGDETAATIVAHRVMSDAPCLTLADGATARQRQLLESVRPTSRCTVVSLPRMAVSSLVPGLGQLTGSRRKGMASAVLLTMGASFAVATMKHSESQKLHDEYLEVTGFETNQGGPNAAIRVLSLYDDAEKARLSGNQMTMLGIGVWVLAGVEAIYFERRHRRRLETVRGVGRSPSRLGVTALPGGHGVGLSINLFD